MTIDTSKPNDIIHLTYDKTTVRTDPKKGGSWLEAYPTTKKTNLIFIRAIGTFSEQEKAQAGEIRDQLQKYHTVVKNDPNSAAKRNAVLLPLLALKHTFLLTKQNEIRIDNLNISCK